MRSDARCPRCFCPVSNPETPCGDCAEARRNGLPDRVEKCPEGAHTAAYYRQGMCARCGATY